MQLIIPKGKRLRLFDGTIVVGSGNDRGVWENVGTYELEKIDNPIKEGGAAWLVLPGTKTGMTEQGLRREVAKIGGMLI